MPDVPIESTVPPIAITQGRPAVLGAKHMVSSSHYLATLAGLRMFPRGGSAIDAGIAAGIALNVFEPRVRGAFSARWMTCWRRDRSAT